MKILLISTLYPTTIKDSRQEVSYALHYFAKDWINLGHEVQVIKVWPEYPFLLTSPRKLNKKIFYKKHSSLDIEEVKVKRLFVKKIPRLNYFSFHIEKAAHQILSFLSHEDKPDIIVCHMINPSLYISIALKESLNIPLILTLHQSDISQLKYKKNYQKFVLNINKVDSYGFRSEKLLKEFEKKFPQVKKKFLIHSGIDKSVIINDEDLQKKVHSSPKTIFIAASMIPLKNIDILLQAFEKVAINKNILLKIAGDGPEKKKLISIAQQSSSYEKIEFLGYMPREKVMEQMEKSDIFVMVSSPETFGLVYLEAMAKGCITIGSKGEGIDGIITDMKNGFLVEPRNIEALFNKLDYILNMGRKEKKEITLNAVKTAKNMTQESLSEKYIRQINYTIEN